MRVQADKKKHTHSALFALVCFCLLGVYSLSNAGPQQNQAMCSDAQHASMVAGQVEAGHLTVYESRVVTSTGATLVKRRLPLAALNTLSPASFGTVQSEVLWDAAALLRSSATRPNYAATRGKLFTARQDGHAWRAIPLEWASLSAAQQAQLNRAPTPAGSDQLGPLRLDYLRGDRSHEQGSGKSLFRRRHSLLEASAIGSPQYVSAPNLSVLEASFQRFAAQQLKRPPMVYLSANHGMVHGFDASTGIEQFAYLPAALLSQMPDFISPEAKLESGLAVEVGAGAAHAQGNWKTVLATGLGAAARGLVVLDVTEPSSVGQDESVLFEFTEADDPDMGYVSAAPQIARVLSHHTEGQPVYKYFVVTANGMASANNQTDHPAALFLLSLDKAPNAPWVDGVNYYKIKLPDVQSALANGLVAPALLSSQEGTLQRAYLADLQGRLWRLGFENKPLAELQRTPQTPYLLFSATDDAGRPQSVTQRLRIVHAPGGYLLLVGTGTAQLPVARSQGSEVGHSFYAIHDDGTQKSVAQHRSDLKQLFLEQHPELDLLRLAPAGGREVMSLGGLGQMTSGWFLDFGAREKASASSGSAIQAEDGLVYFTFRLATAERCTQERLFVLDLREDLEKTGGVPVDARLGNFGLPALMCLPADPSANEKPGSQRAKHVLIAPATNTPENNALHVRTGPAQAAPRSGKRLSWREIINWQELRHAASR